MAFMKKLLLPLLLLIFIPLISLAQSGLPDSGIYFLNLQSSNGITTLKLLVQ
jgi:hypothetical protein